MLDLLLRRSRGRQIDIVPFNSGPASQKAVDSLAQINANRKIEKELKPADHVRRVSLLGFAWNGWRSAVANAKSVKTLIQLILNLDKGEEFTTMYYT